MAITDNLTTSSYKANQIIPNTRTFRYDPRYRLVGATGKKHATVVSKGDQIEIPSPDPGDYDAYDYTYSYDEVGNLTRNDEYAATLNYKSGRIDLFNGDSTEAGSFTAPDEGNFQYDENGNTLKTPRLPALAYTHDNQCRWVKLNGGGDAVRYLRHGDQRVLRFVSKGAVRAVGVYLGPFEVHSRDGGSGGTSYGKVVLHVHGHGRHAQLEQVLSGSDPDSVDVFYHHSDHLGSGHVLTDEAGELLSQEEYFPYGRASDRRDARNRYRYIGVERDEDTGMCVTGPRMYDPVMGRFLEGDPLAEQAPMKTPYHYSSGSPVGRCDPSGCSDWLAGCGSEAEKDVQPVATPSKPEVAFERRRAPMEERQKFEAALSLMGEDSDEFLAFLDQFDVTVMGYTFVKSEQGKLEQAPAGSNFGRYVPGDASKGTHDVLLLNMNASPEDLASILKHEGEGHGVRLQWRRIAEARGVPTYGFDPNESLENSKYKSVLLTQEDWFQEEVDVRAGTAIWANRKGLPQVHTEYLNADGTVNRDAIVEDVMKHYSGGISGPVPAAGLGFTEIRVPK